MSFGDRYGQPDSTWTKVDGSRPFTGTVGGILPTDEAHLATKEYVDLSAGFHFDYFLTDTASDIATYFVMQDNGTGEAESTHTLAGASGGDDQLIVAFATPSGEPGILQLQAGSYDGHLHLERTAGNRTARAYWTLSKYALDTTETVLIISELSPEITSQVEVDIHGVLLAPVELLTSDRLVLKVYVNLSDTPASATTVVLYQEGTADSHITIGTASSVLSNIFVRKDLFDANTIIAADTDDTPVALTVAEQTLVGRITAGNITDLTAAEVRTLISVEENADVTDADNVDAAGAVMEDDFDAKGDILVAASAGGPGPLGVGNDGDVLTAASGAFPGVEWAPPAGGGGAIGYPFTLEDPVAGRWYKIGVAAVAMTITRVAYRTMAGTIDFNLDMRPPTAPETEDTNLVWIAEKEAGTGTAASPVTVFDDDAWAQYDGLYVWIEAISSPGTLYLDVFAEPA